MSRSTVRHKAVVVFALVALAVGVTAVPALGWENEQWEEDNQAQNGGNERDHGNDYGRDDNGGGRDNDNDNSGNDRDYGSEQPPAVTPPPQSGAPQAQPPAATPTPVAPQGGPAQVPPDQPAGGGDTPSQPGGEEVEEDSPVVAQQTPSGAAPAAPLAPVAERKELAQTGLDPGLIALLGVLSVGGGAFLFRRALVRE